MDKCTPCKNLPVCFDKWAMTYELAKQLKDAGFPQAKSDGTYFNGRYLVEGKEPCYDAQLSVLIEAYGAQFSMLEHMRNVPEWCAWEEWQDTERYYCYGSSPEEAVARLWIALHARTNN